MGSILGKPAALAGGGGQGYEDADSLSGVECVEMGGSPVTPSDPRHMYNQEGSDILLCGTRDQILSRVYAYWRQKGFHCIVAEKVLHIVRCAFAIGFTCFLAFYVDWEVATTCRNTPERQCDLFRRGEMNAARTLVLLLEVSFGVSLLFYIGRLVCIDFPILVKTRAFYSRQLGVSDNDVYFGLKGWGDVAARLKAWQQRSEAHRLCAEDPVVLDELAICQCVLREKNYITALFNSGLIRIPFLNTLTVKVIETGIVASFLGFGRATLQVSRDDPVERAARVRRLRGFLVAGAVVMWLLAPVMLGWKLLYSTFRYGLAVREDPGRLAARTWSVHARTSYREFNELSHVFAGRLAKSLGVAQSYIQSYPYHFERILALSVVFLLTGVIGFIVVVLFINDHAYNFEVFGRPLFWWLPVASALALLSGKMTKPASGAVDGERFDPVAGFKKICDTTHWRPEGFNKRSRHLRVFAHFKQRYFPLTILHLLQEAASPLTTPYHIIFCLAPQVDLIADFMLDCTVRVRGVGDCVAFSTFDFEKYASSVYFLRAGTSQETTQYCQNGKMEVSFLSFCTVHAPHYTPSAASIGAIERVVPADLLGSSVEQRQRQAQMQQERERLQREDKDASDKRPRSSSAASSSSRARRGSAGGCDGGGGGGAESDSLLGAAQGEDPVCRRTCLPHSRACRQGTQNTHTSTSTNTQLDRIAALYSAMEERRRDMGSVLKVHTHAAE